MATGLRRLARKTRRDIERAMLPQELIRCKRDGANLDPDEIAQFIEGVTDGRVTEGQVAAFCMAVFFRGLTLTERAALTRAMTQSGTTLDWSAQHLDGPVVDKHSTGGVGDKVSLILAPVLAACGGYVPMISGRGLGHTGGTLDKMEAIPGYTAKPPNDRIYSVTREAGCAIIGATGDVAPADRRMYAIRDVTGTVESLDLITASILSKKVAAGLHALVLDTKFGSGAFKDDLEEASALAESIVAVGKAMGLPVCALLTDMNQVLGRTAGNAVEVIECCDILRGGSADPRLLTVTIDLCAEGLHLCGIADTVAAGRSMAQQSLDSGGAAERFSRMVTALGGPADFLEDPLRHLPQAPVVRAVHPEEAGYVTGMNARDVGVAIIGLGGGRTFPEEAIDHAVGLTSIAAIGESVGPGADDRPLAIVHAATEDKAAAAAAELRAAVRISGEPGQAGPLIARRIT